jgi:hypothetical protein
MEGNITNQLINYRNMKKLLFILVCFLSTGLLIAQDLKLDELLAKNYKAIGQDKFEKIQNYKVTGKTAIQGIQMTMSLTKKRPHLSYVESEIQGTKVLVYFDGQSGWMVNPLTGSSDTVEMSPEMLKQYSKSGQINPFLNWDDPFVKWKEIGCKLELVGKEDLDGKPVYNVSLTPPDSIVVNYYIDATNFLVLKLKSSVKYQGQALDVETKFSDFREVAGITTPFKIENLVNSQTSQVLTYDKLDLNLPINDAILKK